MRFFGKLSKTVEIPTFCSNVKTACRNVAILHGSYKDGSCTVLGSNSFNGSTHFLSCPIPPFYKPQRSLLNGLGGYRYASTKPPSSDEPIDSDAKEIADTEQNDCHLPKDIVPIGLVNGDSTKLLVIPFEMINDEKQMEEHLMKSLLLIRKYANQMENFLKTQSTPLKAVDEDQSNDECLKSNKITTELPSDIEAKLRAMAISSMELAFEMDMTNIKKALMLDSARLKGIKPDNQLDTRGRILGLETKLELDPPLNSHTIPLNFNATIEGKVEVDPSCFTGDLDTDIPQFHENMTSIAATICQTALQKGFENDNQNRELTEEVLNETAELDSEEQAEKTINAYAAKQTSNEDYTADDAVQKQAYAQCKSYDNAITDANEIRAAMSDKNTPPGTPATPNAPATPITQQPFTGDQSETIVAKDAGGPKKNDPCKKKEDPCKKKNEQKNKKDEKKDPCKPKKDKKKDKPKKDQKKDPCKKDDKKDKKDPCKKDDKKDKKEDPCKKKDDKKEKKADPCKKKDDKKDKKADPCKKKDDKKDKKSDPCKPKKKDDKKGKKDDPCKKKDDKKADPCKKKDDKKGKDKKADPCKPKKKDDKKGKKDDPCKKKDDKKDKKADPCKKKDDKKGKKDKKADPCKPKEKKGKDKKADPCKKKDDKKGKDKKADPCKPKKKDDKKGKKDDPCKKKDDKKDKKADPCKKKDDKKGKDKKADPCKKKDDKKGKKDKKVDPCKPKKKNGKDKKGKKDPCKKDDKKDKKADPCKKKDNKKDKKADPCKKKDDKKDKKADPCKKDDKKDKKADPCKPKKKDDKGKKDPCKKDDKGKKDKKADPCKPKKKNGKDKKGKKDPCKKDDKKGKDKKADPCKKKDDKKDKKDPCKKDDKKDKKDPCKKDDKKGKKEKADPCKPKKKDDKKDKKDPCKKDDKKDKKDPCKKDDKKDKKDPCKKDDKKDKKEKADPCKPKKKDDKKKSDKKDPCKKGEKKDPCSKNGKKKDPCKSGGGKKAKSIKNDKSCSTNKRSYYTLTGLEKPIELPETASILPITEIKTPSPVNNQYVLLPEKSLVNSLADINTVKTTTKPRNKMNFITFPVMRRFSTFLQNKEYSSCKGGSGTPGKCPPGGKKRKRTDVKARQKLKTDCFKEEESEECGKKDTRCKDADKSSCCAYKTAKPMKKLKHKCITPKSKSKAPTAKAGPKDAPKAGPKKTK